MKSLNKNIPISNFVNTLLNEKNKQIKENILLGNIQFPKILFYSLKKEKNIFATNSHISFLKYLKREKHILEVREEKSFLEAKVNIADNKLLSIKNYELSHNSNFERYLNMNLNNKKSKSLNNRYKSENNSNSKDKKKNFSSEKNNKNINMSSLPSLGRKNEKIGTLEIKPIQIKSFKSKSKIINHETEEKLEKNAKEFIQKIKNKKKDLLSQINKKHEKFTLKLKNEIDKIERQNKFKLNELSKNNNIYRKNIYNNNIDYYNINNINNNIKKEERKISPYNPHIKNNNKNNNNKYYHYSPYNSHNPKMLKNISKDLLNFNSELYYNNNMPDILQYQYLLLPYYNNNITNKDGVTNMFNFDDIDTYKNNNNNIDLNEIDNEEITNNITRFNINAYRNGEMNIDNSFNKKHLYFFNEPKYEIELTSGDN